MSIVWMFMMLQVASAGVVVTGREEHGGPVRRYVEGNVTFEIGDHYEEIFEEGKLSMVVHPDGCHLKPSVTGWLTVRGTCQRDTRVKRSMQVVDLCVARASSLFSAHEVCPIQTVAGVHLLRVTAMHVTRGNVVGRASFGYAVAGNVQMKGDEKCYYWGRHVDGTCKHCDFSPTCTRSRLPFVSDALYVPDEGVSKTGVVYARPLGGFLVGNASCLEVSAKDRKHDADVKCKVHYTLAPVKGEFDINWTMEVGKLATTQFSTLLEDIVLAGERQYSSVTHIWNDVSSGIVYVRRLLKYWWVVLVVAIFCLAIFVLNPSLGLLIWILSALVLWQLMARGVMANEWTDVKNGCVHNWGLSHVTISNDSIDFKVDAVTGECFVYTDNSRKMEVMFKVHKLHRPLQLAYYGSVAQSWVRSETHDSKCTGSIHQPTIASRCHDGDNCTLLYHRGALYGQGCVFATGEAWLLVQPTIADGSWINVWRVVGSSSVWVDATIIVTHETATGLYYRKMKLSNEQVTQIGWLPPLYTYVSQQGNDVYVTFSGMTVEDARVPYLICSPSLSCMRNFRYFVQSASFDGYDWKVSVKKNLVNSVMATMQFSMESQSRLECKVGGSVIAPSINCCQHLPAATALIAGKWLLTDNATHVGLDIGNVSIKMVKQVETKITMGRIVEKFVVTLECNDGGMKKLPVYVGIDGCSTFGPSVHFVNCTRPFDLTIVEIFAQCASGEAVFTVKGKTFSLAVNTSVSWQSRLALAVEHWFVKVGRHPIMYNVAYWASKVWRDWHGKTVVLALLCLAGVASFMVNNWFVTVAMIVIFLATSVFGMKDAYPEQVVSPIEVVLICVVEIALVLVASLIWLGQKLDYVLSTKSFKTALTLLCNLGACLIDWRIGVLALCAGEVVFAINALWSMYSSRVWRLHYDGYIPHRTLGGYLVMALELVRGEFETCNGSGDGVTTLLHVDGIDVVIGAYHVMRQDCLRVKGLMDYGLCAPAGVDFAKVARKVFGNKCASGMFEYAGKKFVVSAKRRECGCPYGWESPADFVWLDWMKGRSGTPVDTASGIHILGNWGVRRSGFRVFMISKRPCLCSNTRRGWIVKHGPRKSVNKPTLDKVQQEIKRSSVEAHLKELEGRVVGQVSVAAGLPCKVVKTKMQTSDGREELVKATSGWLNNSKIDQEARRYLEDPLKAKKLEAGKVFDRAVSATLKKEGVPKERKKIVRMIKHGNHLTQMEVKVAAGLTENELEAFKVVVCESDAGGVSLAQALTPFCGYVNAKNGLKFLALVSEAQIAKHRSLTVKRNVAIKTMWDWRNDPTVTTVQSKLVRNITLKECREFGQSTTGNAVRFVEVWGSVLDAWFGPAYAWLRVLQVLYKGVNYVGPLPNSLPVKLYRHVTREEVKKLGDDVVVHHLCGCESMLDANLHLGPQKVLGLEWLHPGRQRVFPLVTDFLGTEVQFVRLVQDCISGGLMAVYEVVGNNTMRRPNDPMSQGLCGTLLSGVDSPYIGGSLYEGKHCLYFHTEPGDIWPRLPHLTDIELVTDTDVSVPEVVRVAMCCPVASEGKPTLAAVVLASYWTTVGVNVCPKSTTLLKLMRVVKELDEDQEPDLMGFYESDAINTLVVRGCFRVVTAALRNVVRSVLHDADTPEMVPRLLELVMLQDQIRLARTQCGGAGMLALSYGIVGRNVVSTVGSELAPASWVRGVGTGCDGPAGYFMMDDVDTDWELFRQYTDATTISLNSVSVGQPGSAGYSWEMVQPVDDGSWIIPLATTLTTAQRLGAGVGIVKGRLVRNVPVQDAIYEIGNGLLRNGFGFVVGGVLVTCYHITFGEPLVMSDMSGDVVHIVADVVDPERDLVLYGGTSVPFSTDVPTHTKCCVVNPKIARRITLECVGSETWAGGNCLQFATLMPTTTGFEPMRRDRGIRGWSGLPIISDEYGVVGIYGRSCCSSAAGDWHVVSPTSGGKEVTFASEVNLAMAKHEKQEYDEHMVISVPTGFGKSTVFPVKLYQAFVAKYNREPRIILAIPTRAAAENVYHRLSTSGKLTPRNCHLVLGGDDTDLSKIVGIIVTTHGKLRVSRAVLQETDFVLLDECHEAVRNFDAAATMVLTRVLNVTVVVEMSASLTSEVIASRYSVSDSFVSADPESTRVISCGDERYDAQGIPTDGVTIVFMPTRRSCEEAASVWRRSGQQPKGYVFHGGSEGLDQAISVAALSTLHNGVIFATNAIETGVTINNVVCVFDTRLENVRETTYEVDSNGIHVSTHMCVTPTSRSSMIQRRGRVGRTQSGKYLSVKRPVVGQLVDQGLLSRLYLWWTRDLCLSTASLQVALDDVFGSVDDSIYAKLAAIEDVFRSMSGVTTTKCKIAMLADCDPVAALLQRELPMGGIQSLWSGAIKRGVATPNEVVVADYWREVPDAKVVVNVDDDIIRETFGEFEQQLNSAFGVTVALGSLVAVGVHYYATTEKSYCKNGWKVLTWYSADASTRGTDMTESERRISFKDIYMRVRRRWQGEQSNNGNWFNELLYEKFGRHVFTDLKKMLPEMVVGSVVGTTWKYVLERLPNSLGVALGGYVLSRAWQSMPRMSVVMTLACATVGWLLTERNKLFDEGVPVRAWCLALAGIVGVLLTNQEQILSVMEALPTSNADGGNLLSGLAACGTIATAAECFLKNYKGEPIDARDVALSIVSSSVSLVDLDWLGQSVVAVTALLVATDCCHVAAVRKEKLMAVEREAKINASASVVNQYYDATKRLQVWLKCLSFVGMVAKPTSAITAVADAGIEYLRTKNVRWSKIFSTHGGTHPLIGVLRILANLLDVRAAPRPPVQSRVRATSNWGWPGGSTVTQLNNVLTWLVDTFKAVWSYLKRKARQYMPSVFCTVDIDNQLATAGQLWTSDLSYIRGHEGEVVFRTEQPGDVIVLTPAASLEPVGLFAVAQATSLDGNELLAVLRTVTKGYLRPARHYSVVVDLPEVKGLVFFSSDLLSGYIVGRIRARSVVLRGKRHKLRQVAKTGAWSFGGYHLEEYRVAASCEVRLVDRIISVSLVTGTEIVGFDDFGMASGHLAFACVDGIIYSNVVSDVQVKTTVVAANWFDEWCVTDHERASTSRAETHCSEGPWDYLLSIVGKSADLMPDTEKKPRKLLGFLGGYPNDEKVEWYGSKSFSVGGQGPAVEEYQTTVNGVWAQHKAKIQKNPHVGYYTKPCKQKEVSRGFFKAQALMDATSLPIAGRKVLCLAEGKGGFAQYLSMIMASMVVIVTMYGPGRVLPTLESVRQVGEVAIYQGKNSDGNILRRGFVDDMKCNLGVFDGVTFDGGESHDMVVEDGKWLMRFEQPLLRVVDEMVRSGGWLVVKVLHGWGAEPLIEEITRRFAQSTALCVPDRKAMSGEWYLVCKGKLAGMLPTGNCSLIVNVKQHLLQGMKLTEQRLRSLARGAEGAALGMRYYRRAESGSPVYRIETSRACGFGDYYFLGKVWRTKAPGNFHCVSKHRRCPRLVYPYVGYYDHIQLLAVFDRKESDFRDRIVCQPRLGYLVYKVFGWNIDNSVIGVTSRTKANIRLAVKTRLDIPWYRMSSDVLVGLYEAMGFCVNDRTQRFNMMTYGAVAGLINRKGAIGFLDVGLGNDLGDCYDNPIVKDMVLVRFEKLKCGKSSGAYMTLMEKYEKKGKKNASGGLLREVDNSRLVRFPVPRLIQYWDVVTRLMDVMLFGEMLVADEVGHKIYWGSASGIGLVDIFDYMYYHGWRRFKKPVALCGDFSRFDHHQSKLSYGAECLVLESLYADGVKEVIHNRYAEMMEPIVIDKHGQIFTRFGQRGSGEQLTSFANGLQNAAMHLNSLAVCFGCTYEDVKTRVAGFFCGDDNVLIMEEEDARRFMALGPKLMARFGHEIKSGDVEGYIWASVFEQVDFCSHKPVHTVVAGRYRWLPLRPMTEIFGKMAINVRTVGKDAAVVQQVEAATALSYLLLYPHVRVVRSICLVVLATELDRAIDLTHKRHLFGLKAGCYTVAGAVRKLYGCDLADIWFIRAVLEEAMIKDHLFNRYVIDNRMWAARSISLYVKSVRDVAIEGGWSLRSDILALYRPLVKK